MGFSKFALALVGLMAAGAIEAQTYTALTPTTCPTDSSGLFTTGQQYLDSNNNGVLKDSWSMLVRWQGNPTVGNTQWVSDPLSYALAEHTGYTPPAPYSNWQRGFQPESQVAATPGVELYGCDASMLLNTWQTPHAGTPVLGGGFNDMYGYAWSNPPYAFKVLKYNQASNMLYWVSSDLVLQGNLAVPQIGAYTAVLRNGTWRWSTAHAHKYWTYGSIEFSLFAYLVDTTHPNLHPIAILATAYTNAYQYSDVACSSWQYGNIAFDYAPPAAPNGVFGVWSASAPFCNTDVTTIDSTTAATAINVFPNPTFYRIHITPQNLTTIVHRINSLYCGGGTEMSRCTQLTGSAHPPKCVPGSSCPAVGYSTDPGVYKLQYVGVIGEIEPCDDPANDTFPPTHVSCSTNLQYPGNANYNPNQDSNVGAALRASHVAAYSYTIP